VRIVAVLLLASVGAGCFWREKKREPAPAAFTVRPPGANTNLVIKPATSAVGRVASVNLPGKFVVLSFPIGQLPTNDARLAIFHAGAKVGEVRVTGPAQENLTVGDITAGTAEDGDEARTE
jgi:hypothetical protein